MNSLFGVELPSAVNFLIVFLVVLVLAGAATWAIRRFGMPRLDASSRGRQPRLAVVDAAPVDGRRKLLIVRRDNVEHLLMIGGPSDVVVETNIVRSGTTATATRDTPVARNGGAELPRAVPLPDPTPWPLQPEPAPAAVEAPVVAPPRAERAAQPAVEEADDWPGSARDPAPAVQPPARPADAFTGLAADLARTTPELTPAPRATPERSRPPAPPPAPSGQPSAPVAEHNLAEMAQRLEAALRRPVQGGKAEPGRAEPKLSKIGMAASAKAAPAPQAPKQQFSNIEQEMASLLGRPGKN